MDKICRIWCSPPSDRVPSLRSCKPFDYHQRTTSYLPHKGICPIDDIVQRTCRAFAELIEHPVEETDAFPHCLIKQHSDACPLRRANAGSPKGKSEVLTLPGGTPHNQDPATRVAIVSDIGKAPVIPHDARYALLKQWSGKYATQTSTTANPGRLSQIGPDRRAHVQCRAANCRNQRITGRGRDTFDETSKGTIDLCCATISRGGKQGHVLIDGYREDLVLKL